MADQDDMVERIVKNYEELISEGRFTGFTDTFEKILRSGKKYSLFTLDKTLAEIVGCGGTASIPYVTLKVILSNPLKLKGILYYLVYGFAGILGISLTFFSLSLALYSRGLKRLSKRRIDKLFTMYTPYTKVFLFLYYNIKEFRELVSKKDFDRINRILERIMHEVPPAFVETLEEAIYPSKILWSKGRLLLEYIKKGYSAFFGAFTYLAKKFAGMIKKGISVSPGKLTSFIPFLERMKEFMQAISEFGEGESVSSIYLPSKVLGNIFDQYLPSFIFYILYTLSGNFLYLFLAGLSGVFGLFSTILAIFYVLSKPISFIWGKYPTILDKIAIGGYHLIDKPLVFMLWGLDKVGLLRNISLRNSLYKTIEWMKRNTDFGMLYKQPIKGRKERIISFIKEHFTEISGECWTSSILPIGARLRKLLGKEKRSYDVCREIFYRALSKVTLSE